MDNMKIRTILLIFMLILLLGKVNASENDLVIYEVYYNSQPATVYNAELKVGEPFIVIVEAYLKKDTEITAVLYATGFNKDEVQPFEVIEGPSKLNENARDFDKIAGENVSFKWKLKPTNAWAGGIIPLNIAFNFYDPIEKQGNPLTFTVANIFIKNEQYSGPAPTRTASDPSSTDQPPFQGLPGFGVAGALLGIALVVMARRN
jgi:sarcinarray family protein